MGGFTTPAGWTPLHRTAVLVLLLALGVGVSAAVAEAARASDFVYQHNLPSGGDPDGNLWLMDEDQEPGSLSRWGQNPALDTTGTEVVYRGENGIEITNGTSTEMIFETTWAFPRPQWWPDEQSIITDNANDIIKLTESGGEWTSSTIIDWPGAQSYPSVSPDGSRITFLSKTFPSGEWVGEPHYWALFVANANGSDAQALTDPDFSDPAGFFPYSASFGPDGDRIAVYGYNNDESIGWDAEIFIVDAQDGSIIQVTSNELTDLDADWLEDGRIAFTALNEDTDEAQLRAISPDGSGEKTLSPLFDDTHNLGSISGVQPDGEQDPPPPPEPSLLERYAPELRYDSQETFFADSASLATDFAGISASSIPGNQLEMEDGTPIAGHSGGLPELNLDFLGGTYPTEMTALGGDYIDEQQDGEIQYSLAASWLRAQDPGLYADKVYGRSFATESHLWLQYWLFYYYNPYAPLLGRGTHEGDWELVQVGLDPVSYEPQTVVYSQHSSGEGCDWSATPKTAYGPDLAPVVYVGRGSHANFFATRASGIAQERSDGQGETVRPSVIDVSTAPDWISWPGYWGSTRKDLDIPAPGGTIPLSADSPRGPAFQGARWSDPAAYAEEVGECPVSAATAPASAQSPEGPRISLERKGPDTVLVSYRLPVEASAFKHLLLTIDSSDPGAAPAGGIFSISRRSATRALPLPPGSGPYVIRASWFAADGTRSQVAVATLDAPG